ncbi:MAG: peptidylprolyl isomerase [Dehalococcoidia bacterium]
MLITGCSILNAGPQAKAGDTVQVNYTGKLADGTVFDSSVGGQPLQFTLGSGQVIPGFDKAVTGMRVGEKKTVTILAADAYGQRRDDLVAEVSRSQLPGDMAPKVGMQLQTTAKDGSTMVVTIIKVTDNTSVTIDANHPLAGKDLTFDLELLKIL